MSVLIKGVEEVQTKPLNSYYDPNETVLSCPFICTRIALRDSIQMTSTGSNRNPRKLSKYFARTIDMVHTGIIDLSGRPGD